MQKLKISPYLQVLLSFALVILLGSILLVLPWSYQSGHSPSYWNALMLSTSAVCVTGLSPFADLSITLSGFGKVILLILVQIGGLGFITIFTFVLSLLGVKIGAIDKYMIKEALNINIFAGVVSFVKKVICYTLIIEAIGLVLCAFVFVPELGWGQGLWISLFHAVSAFNNAGFDLLGDASMMAYSGHVFLNIITMLLIIIGGLGFPVLDDIFRRRPRKWSSYTKIVLLTSSILIVFGTLAFYLFERGNGITFLQALFQSVTARTAGFSTMDMRNLTVPGQIITDSLMFIGASPLSTGGGIKTTTFFVIAISIFSFIRGKKPVIFHRAISQSSLTKAMSLIFTALGVLFTGYFAIVLIERANGLTTEADSGRILFETFSAFGTVGLSQGLTPSLHMGSKVVLCFLMFFGRVGPMTVLSVLSKNMNKEEKNHVRYIEDNVVIG